MVLPPLPYVVVILGATIMVAALLWALEPSVDQKLVLAFAPWMAIGGALHAFYQLPAAFDTYPAVWRPLFSAPTAYLTTFVLTGFVWVLLGVIGISRGHSGNVPRNLGLTGTGVLTVLFVNVVYQGVTLGTFEPVWPTVALVASLVVTALVTLAIGLWRTPVFFRIRYAGPTVIFAHALDGISTAIGADVLVGVSERSPVPRAIMEFAGTLPTAELLGVGWLFVLVKLAVASGIAVAFHDYLEEDPVEATLLLGAVAAVGLGPATNNLFLFLASAH